MTVRPNALTVLAVDPARLASFWGDLLGWSRSGATLAGSPFGLVFVPSDEPVRLPAQAHLHLTSNDRTQEETVARALALGASHVDVGQQPDEGHVVLADPEGNALCVIEAGNNWLAGAPLLGEVACDGTREVGLFWRDALGWPTRTGHASRTSCPYRNPSDGRAPVVGSSHWLLPRSLSCSRSPASPSATTINRASPPLHRNLRPHRPTRRRDVSSRCLLKGRRPAPRCRV